VRTRSLRALVAVAVLAVVPAVAGCSGDDTPSRPATDVLAAAKKNLDETSGLRLSLVADGLPPGVNGLLDAKGVATHAPAFKGDIRVAASGITADAAVVAVGGKVHAKLPFTSSFQVIDPAQFGAPDPAALMSSDHGLSSLLTSAQDVKRGKQVRDGKTVLTRYTGDVPGSAVKQVIPSASASATFPATFTVTDDDELRKAVLTGPFYPKADKVTYTVDFTDYGSSPTITAP